MNYNNIVESVKTLHEEEEWLVLNASDLFEIRRLADVRETLEELYEKILGLIEVGQIRRLKRGGWITARHISTKSMPGEMHIIGLDKIVSIKFPKNEQT